MLDAVAKRAQSAGFVIHWGRKVLEVRPPVRFDKGAGITGLIRQAGSRVALYAGDDATDLDAFRALGRSCRSGGTRPRASASASVPRTARPTIATAADITVEGTQGVRDLLASLAADR